MDRAPGGGPAQGLDLGFFTQEQLHSFFKENKSELSSTEEPERLLRCLRDYDIITQEEYGKVSRTAERLDREEALYTVLDRLGTEELHVIKGFWSCAFKGFILECNPTLQRLQHRLLEMLDLVEVKEEERWEEQEEETGTATPLMSFWPPPPQQDITAGHLYFSIDRHSPAPPSPEVPESTEAREEQRPEELQPAPSTRPVSIRLSKLPFDTRQQSTIKYHEFLLLQAGTASLGTLQRKEGREEQKDESGPSRRSRSLQPRKTPHMPPQGISAHADEEEEGFEPWQASLDSSPETLERSEVREEEEKEEPGLPTPSRSLQQRKPPPPPMQYCTTGVPGNSGRRSGLTGHCSNGSVYRRALLVSSEEEDSAELTPPIPVTCGEKEGTLHPDKLAKGSRVKSILSEGRWFSPPEFEMFGGKGSWKNWKLSIRSRGISLSLLIQEGLLRCPVQTHRKTNDRTCSPGHRWSRRAAQS
ncbi:sp110 nuclear body protein isoform X2 [Amia ocellicauda]